MLTISGKREAGEARRGRHLVQLRAQLGSFTRSFTLPEAADGEHVRADLRDGVLTLMLPKRPELQPKRIAVGSGAPPKGGAEEGQGVAVPRTASRRRGRPVSGAPVLP